MFAVVNGSLVAKLADTMSLAVSADAIRIEYVGGPEIRYASSGPSLVIDGTPATAVDFGPSERATKTVKYLAVTNTTAADITLMQLTQADMPAGYVLESGFSSLTVAPGGISFFRGERTPQPLLTLRLASRVDRDQPIAKEAGYGSAGR